MTSETEISRTAPKVGLLAMALFVATMSSADCVQDMHGEVYCGAGHCLIDREGRVWCSRYYEGGVVRTLNGQVLCGKGQCAKDINGRAFCSSEIGGAVLVDTHGRVRCYGRCESASIGNCENTRAD